MCVVKYSEGIFNERIMRTPTIVIVCWVLFALSVLTFSLVFLGKKSRGESADVSAVCYHYLQYLGWNHLTLKLVMTASFIRRFLILILKTSTAVI